MDNQKKPDPFGVFQNQAQNYQLDRPRYPEEFIQEIELKCQKKDSFLDIAAGTGILYHKLASQFNGRKVANDISDKQLKVCEDQAKEQGLKDAEFIVGDSLDLPKLMESKAKFDLITIGQGLHWFDTDKFSEMVSEQLLSDDGLYAVVGYFCDGIDYNFPNDKEFMGLGQGRYDEFYTTISPFWKCDRVSLDKGHSNYDFTKRFANFERKEVEIRKEVDIEAFIKYANTFSAYNLMRKENESNSSFDDPKIKMENKIVSDLEKYAQAKAINVPSNPLILKMHFFLLTMKKAIKK